MMNKEVKWRGSCEDCNFWEFHDDGYGHCGLNALGCAESISSKGYPTRFLSRDDVVEIIDKDKLDQEIEMSRAEAEQEAYEKYNDKEEDNGLLH